MNDVVDGLRQLVEPQASQVTHDESLSQPNDFDPNTVYAWPTSWRRVQAGTGAVDDGEVHGEVDEQFGVRLVYVAKNPGEESSGTRDRDVSLALMDKAQTWLDLISVHRVDPLWDNISAVVDWDFIRQFDLRGVSVVVTGNRLRSS